MAIWQLNGQPWTLNGVQWVLNGEDLSVHKGVVRVRRRVELSRVSRETEMFPSHITVRFDRGPEIEVKWEPRE